MNNELINTLIQIPIVAIFIWYSLRLTYIYQSSQQLRDEKYLDALDKITKSINLLENKIELSTSSLRKNPTSVEKK